MKRGLLNLLTVLSVLLCVAVVGAWVRSHLPEQFHVRSYHGRLHLIFAAEQWRMFDEHQHVTAGEILQEIRGFASWDPGSVQWTFAGFELSLSDRQSGFWMLAVPYWALTVPSSAAAVWAVRAHRTRKGREKAGQCASCGYDLRASQGRCPECGTAAVKQSDSGGRTGRPHAVAERGELNEP